MRPIVGAGVACPLPIATALDIRHKRTQPFRPQTNGKSEHFNRTLLDEWAYARAYTSNALSHR